MGDTLRHVRLSSGHTLRLWDTGRTDSMGKSILGYSMQTPPGAFEVLFSGEDYHCAPGHAVDSDADLLALLGFLTLQPGDTDAEYFDKYTDAQDAWAGSSECESLACDVSIAEECGGCACGTVWENLDKHECPDAPTVADFEVRDMGEDGSQYFPGVSTVHTKWEHVQLGVGDTAKEALEDALENMASSSLDARLSAIQAKRAHENLSDPDHSAFAQLDHEECREDHDGDDWNHYVAVFFNLRKAD